MKITTYCAEAEPGESPREALTAALIQAKLERVTVMLRPDAARPRIITVTSASLMAELMDEYLNGPAGLRSRGPWTRTEPA